MLKTGATIVVVAALAAIVGPWLVSSDPAAQELALRLVGPTWAHPFGLDELGRDILARVVAGARISFFVGITVVSISASVGTPLGAIFKPEQGAAVLDAALKKYPDRASWDVYAQLVRQRIQEHAELAPWPKRLPLNAVIHSRREHDGYSVENVFFEIGRASCRERV